MRKSGHIVFGLIVGMVFILFTCYLGFNWFNFSLKSSVAMFGIIGLYSLLPDIDHKASTITHWFFGLGILGVCFGILEMYIHITSIHPVMILIISSLFLLCTYVSSNLMKHRGKIHTVQLGILAVLPLWILFHSTAFCLLGYVAWHSHLLADGYLFKVK